MVAVMEKDKLIQEALEWTNEYGVRDAETNAGKLKAFSVFPKAMLDAIRKLATDAELDELVVVTAGAVMAQVEKLGLDLSERYKLGWSENSAEICDAVQKAMPVLFHEVVIEEKRMISYSHFEQTIEIEGRNQDKHTTALLDKVEGTQRIKEIAQNFEIIAKEFMSDTALPDEDKNSLRQKLIRTKDKCIHFVGQKVSESPARIKFYRSGNRVVTKVNINSSSCSYYQGEGKYIRRNKGEDKREFPFIVSAGYVESFLRNNKVREQDVLIETEGISKYYGFDEVISPSLTKSFIDKWYSYDCPTLYRFEPNTERSAVIAGMKPVLFETSLIETTWSDVYVDSSIDDNEIAQIIKHYPKSAITRELHMIIESRELEILDGFDKLLQYIEEYDQKIQRVIDHHASEIVARAEEALGVPFNKADFGLDAGFLSVYNYEDEYTHKRAVLANYDLSYGKTMKVTMPEFSMSTTIMKAQFDIAKEIVKKELGISLYARTVLD